MNTAEAQHEAAIQEKTEYDIAEEALTKRQRTSVIAYQEWRKALLAGEVQPSKDIQKKWNHYAGIAAEAQAREDAFALEVLERVKRDQLGRLDVMFLPGELLAKFQVRELPLHPDDELAVVKLLKLDIARIDAVNTAWLKQELADRDGQWWPISEVGPRTSGNLWLLVQHADQDPGFQSEVLGLMEPMVAEENIDSGNFAYLYDRVNDPQRYGTQMMCLDGAYVPQPLEAPERLDELRESVGLMPFDDYLALFDPAHCAQQMEVE